MVLNPIRQEQGGLATNKSTEQYICVQYTGLGSYEDAIVSRKGIASMIEQLSEWT